MTHFIRRFCQTVKIYFEFLILLRNSNAPLVRLVFVVWVKALCVILVIVAVKKSWRKEEKFFLRNFPNFMGFLPSFSKFLLRIFILKVARICLRWGNEIWSKIYPPNLCIEVLEIFFLWISWKLDFLFIVALFSERGQLEVRKFELN